MKPDWTYICQLNDIPRQGARRVARPQGLEELGALAANSGLYCLITYGDRAERTAITAAAKGQKTLHAHSWREAADALLSRVAPGDAILVKASRGMALEKVLELFYAEFPKK